MIHLPVRLQFHPPTIGFVPCLHSAFVTSSCCICVSYPSHLWNVRLLWSCCLTWSKTTQQTHWFVKRKNIPTFLLRSLRCTCLCGENHCDIITMIFTPKALNCVKSWETNLMNHQLLWQIYWLILWKIC